MSAIDLEPLNVRNRIRRNVPSWLLSAPLEELVQLSPNVVPSLSGRLVRAVPGSQTLQESLRRFGCDLVDTAAIGEPFKLSKAGF